MTLHSSTLRTARRAVCAALVGATLLAGAAQAGPPARYGAWTTFHQDGLAGVLTSYDDGSMLSLLVREDKFHLVLSNPRWRLRVGSAVEVTVVVDNQTSFGDRARVIGRDMIDVVVDNPNFLRAFVHGRAADIRALGERWSTSLEGSADATREMLRRLSAV